MGIMNFYKLIIASVFIFAVGTGCSDSDEPGNSLCDELTIVSQSEFDNAPNDFVTIVSTQLIGDCLTIEYASSGCDGESWVVLLIDSGQVAESFPVQKTLRLSLDNKEVCDANIGQTKTFDLTPIQVNNENQILINLNGFDSKILYEY